MRLKNLGDTFDTSTLIKSSIYITVHIKKPQLNCSFTLVVKE